MRAACGIIGAMSERWWVYAIGSALAARGVAQLEDGLGTVLIVLGAILTIAA